MMQNTMSRLVLRRKFQLTLQLSIVNTKLFLPKTSQNDWSSKKYVIIEYLYIYWFITFLQKEFRVMWVHFWYY